MERVALLYFALLGVSLAYPNYHYMNKTSLFLPFINSIPGKLDDFNQEHDTIETLQRNLHISNNASASRSPFESTKRTNLLELAKNLNLTALVAAIKKAGMDDVIDHEGPFTLFGPTDEAFANAPDYCKNVPLKDVMKYHVVRGSYTSDVFKNDLQLPTLLRDREVRINIYSQSQETTASGRKISKPDNKASNGFLHVLSDIMCSIYEGSAIHEIQKCPSFSKLTMALAVTGLSDLLNSTGPYTVFAPTDKAVDKLDPAVVNQLSGNFTALKEVLLYHVVPAVWYVAGLNNGDLKTLQGEKVKITTDSVVNVNDAVIVLPDATVSNGVVHAIDTVLLPKSLRKEKQEENDFRPFVSVI